MNGGRSSLGSGAGRRMAALVGLALVAASIGMAACDEAGSSAVPSFAPLDVAIELLREGTSSERREAADTLAELGDAAAVPALSEALSDESWDVRWRAAEALSTVGDERAADALLALVAEPLASLDVPDDDAWAAETAYGAAIRALGVIGDARAVPRLVEIATAEDSAVNAGAAGEALVAIGSAAVPGVTAALETASDEQAAEIVTLLGTLGGAALEPLVAALGDKRADVRLAAASALGGFGEAAIEPLRAALGHKDGELRAEAARSLAEIGDTGSTAALVALLADKETRIVASWALAQLHADDATPLLKYLKSKKTVGVFRPLIRIGQDDTVSALVKALNKFGTKSMGEVYLNSGNPALEKAAKAWARAHGYEVVTRPGSGEETWGSR